MIDDDLKDLEEAKAKLRALGIDPENPSWVKSKAVDLAELPTIKRQKELLSSLGDILRAQVEQDLNQIQSLHEQVARLKRGGGR